MIDSNIFKTTGLSTQQQQQQQLTSSTNHFFAVEKRYFFARKFMLSYVALKLCAASSFTQQQQSNNTNRPVVASIMHHFKFRFFAVVVVCVVYIMVFIARRKMVGSSINTWICQKNDLRTKSLKFFLLSRRKTNDFWHIFFLLDHNNKLGKVFAHIKCFFLSLFLYFVMCLNIFCVCANSNAWFRLIEYD